MDRKWSLRSSFLALMVVSARLNLISLLILLAGYLILYQSYLRKGYISWYIFSVEASANCMCQTLVGDRTVALRSSL